MFTTAAYFMLQPVEDKTPMAFAYEKEAVGEVHRAVSPPSCRARRARAPPRSPPHVAPAQQSPPRVALLKQSTSQVPALDDNGNLVVKSGMSNAH